MTILVVGATGNTGRPLVEQLLKSNYKVRVIVRSISRLPAAVIENPNLAITEANLLDLTDEEIAEHVDGCDAVISCLGHVINISGIFGKPRKLCTDASRRLCSAIEKNQLPKPAKFILMNTVAVKNPDLPNHKEKRTLVERGLLMFYRQVLPPAGDNESAAEYLHTNVGKKNNYIEWCCVRPESLTNAEVSPYEISESPVSSIFSGLPTARANVAQFMTELVGSEELWNRWKFRMPVIVNSTSSSQKET
jgi:hypothetical protein